MITPFRPLLVAMLTAGATAQLPCWNSNLGSNLGLTDETISTAKSLGFAFAYGGSSYTDIQICDNGYVTLGATGGAPDWDPQPITLTGDPFGRICPLWIDLQPGLPGSGQVWFNTVPAVGNDPAHAVITWLDCFEYFGATPHTFQLVLIDGGGIRCSYDANLGANSSPWLIGASPGAGAAQNVVSFAGLPLATSGNATLHETGAGAFALAGTTIEWAIDGSGGYVVDLINGCASWTSYGTGCVGQFTSVYEWFQTTPSIDLSNSAFQLVFTGNAYVVSSSATAFVPPSAGAANLNLSDDSETAVTLASALPIPGGATVVLLVASNGHIATASNGAAFDFSPTPAELLAWPNTAWAVWRDFIPGAPGGGSIFFEEIGNLSIFTWDGVLGYAGTAAGTTPSTHQLQFDRTTGNVEFVFGQLDTISVSGFAGGEGWVIGFSPGGASVDPGSTDLSTALLAGSLTTFGADVAPLAIAMSAPPVVTTTIDFEVTNIAPTAAFGGLLYGLNASYAGINLASFGMPGCFQYNNQVAVTLFFPGGATSYAMPFTIPNFPGVPLYVQAAALDIVAPLTPLGAVASNGVEFITGL